MAEYPTWWPHPRYAHCCTLSHVLHEQCGHVEQMLRHTQFQVVNAPKDKWHEMGSLEAMQEMREAHESCPSLKTLYLLQQGQCSKCTYYQQVPAKPRSVLDRLTGKRDTTLADRLDHSQLLSPKRKEQREQRLNKWKHENEQQKFRDQQFSSRKPHVSQTQAAFEEKLAALRAQEDRDNVPLEDRILIYDEDTLYSEMLSAIADQREAAKCCGCNRHLYRHTDRYNDELMKMPCRHTIHYLCFKRLFYSSLRSDRLQCPACRRKYRVLMKPKFAAR